MISEKTKYCDMCEEAEAVYLDTWAQTACGACARIIITQCQNENCFTETEADYGWEPGEPLPETKYCEKCQATSDKQESFDNLDRQVNALFDKYGWDWELESVASTGSKYYLASKYRNDDAEYGILKVRVADHDTVYCSEDISLVSGSATTPDDLNFLVKRLENPVWEGC